MDAPELLSGGGNGERRLLRYWRLEQCIAAGSHLAQTRADDEKHIGFFHAPRELRVDADTDVARVVRAAVVDQILATERSADRQAGGLDPALQLQAGVAVPAPTPDQNERPLRFQEEFSQ